MDARAVLLIGETDSYDGVTVTVEEPMDAEVFTERLRASLSHWRQEVFTSSISLSGLCGFDYSDG